ncbi:hypothetical protein [Nitrospira sp. Nam74]
MRRIDESERGCDLEIDRGIDASTAPLVVEAGAMYLWLEQRFSGRVEK